MWPRFQFFFRKAVSALVRSKSVTTISVVSIAAALAILTTFVVLVGHLDNLALDLGREVQMSVYLEKKITSEDGLAAATRIREFPNVQDAVFLSSAEALADFQRSLGEESSLLKGLPSDVLPPSVEVSLARRAFSYEEISSLSARLQNVERVDSVSFGAEDIQRVHAILGFTRVVTWVVGLSLCLATVLIVSNTIRLTLYARREEIEVMSLVGATRSFVRAPFVLEGVFQGFFGGLLAGLLLWSLENVVEVGVNRAMIHFSQTLRFDIVPLEAFGFIILFGVALGLFGSVVAVGRFLRV